MPITDLTLATATPRLLSPTSAWVEHIPFAFALVEMTRPRRIVELGVHAGDSYCAFCQAVEALHLPARCIGIDSWKGDRHSGEYGPDVIRLLRRHHDPLYGRFSRLLKSAFDDAVPRFSSESIDLLHIDGLHTYDAVAHDFAAWFPKISPRGVVMFHDTQVRERGFGVHEFWPEIAGRFRSFEFLHGSGLGILAMPGACQGLFLEFMDWADEKPDEVRKTFADLGQRIARERELRFSPDAAPPVAGENITKAPGDIASSH